MADCCSPPKGPLAGPPHPRDRTPLKTLGEEVTQTPDSRTSKRGIFGISVTRGHRLSEFSERCLVIFDRQQFSHRKPFMTLSWSIAPPGHTHSSRPPLPPPPTIGTDLVCAAVQ